MTTFPVRDDAELQRVYDYARTHPENWYQLSWRVDTPCGTTYCMAGFKAFVFDGLTSPKVGDVFATTLNPDDPYYANVLVNGERVDTPEYARRALGLTPREAKALFLDATTPDDVGETVKAILNNEYRDAA